MSQIKKALERARAERLSLGISEEGAQTPPETPEVRDEPVCYTRTCVREVPTEKLLENRIVAVDETNPATDQFKLLRTHIFRITRPRKWNVIQVTGFGPGEGKSVVAVNLAVSIARDTRQTTLLVDLDFRRPSVHELLALGKDTVGLKSYFLDGVPLEELFVSPGIQKLSVLTAGGTIPHATELLGSPKMEALLRELKQRYDDRYVILDTPGVNVCPDPLVIAGYEHVDGVLFVARVDRTSREDIKNAMGRVPKEKVLGVVLNDVSPDDLPAYAYTR